MLHGEMYPIFGYFCICYPEECRTTEKRKSNNETKNARQHKIKVSVIPLRVNMSPIMKLSTAFHQFDFT